MEWPRFKKKSEALLGNPPTTPPPRTTKSVGDAAENAALAHLLAAGLRLVARNFKTPGRGGGEIDLIMRERDGTLVFVEVRRRASGSHGGAGASVSAIKQRRIVFAARHYLMHTAPVPPCRFDVVLVQGDANSHSALPALDWIRAAFDAGES